MKPLSLRIAAFASLGGSSTVPHPTTMEQSRKVTSGSFFPVPQSELYERLEILTLEISLQIGGHVDAFQSLKKRRKKEMLGLSNRDLEMFRFSALF